MNEQRFDKWLQEALDTDVRSSDDFTARVMDRVAATPQEYPKKNTVDKRKLKRMMTALAACAAIVVLIPVGLMMMPMGKSAPAADGADCAASESFVMDDAAADMEYFTEDGDNYNGAAGLERTEEADPKEGAVAPADDGITDGGEAEMQYTNTSDEKGKGTAMMVVAEDEVEALRTALEELGIVPVATVGNVLHYDLDAEQTAQLRQMLPELIDAEGVLHLALEVRE